MLTILECFRNATTMTFQEKQAPSPTKFFTYWLNAIKRVLSHHQGLRWIQRVIVLYEVCKGWNPNKKIFDLIYMPRKKNMPAGLPFVKAYHVIFTPLLPNLVMKKQSGAWDFKFISIIYSIAILMPIIKQFAQLARYRRVWGVLYSPPALINSTIPTARTSESYRIS